MLRAIIHRKSWRKVADGVDEERYVGSEDLLTASIFSRLSYLSEERASAFLSLLLPREFMEGAGGIVRVRFWPHVKFENSYVEPDVIIEFEHSCLVVEAKRWDGAPFQKAEQLSGQWIAAKAELPPGSRVGQLAIGGHPRSLRHTEEAAGALKTSPDQVLFARSWGDLTSATIGASRAAAGADLRLLLDMMESLKIHQVFPKPWSSVETLRPAGFSGLALPQFDQPRTVTFGPLSIHGPIDGNIGRFY